MATVTPSPVPNSVGSPALTTAWDLSGKTTTDTFLAQEMSGNADRSVQFAGTFNGATVQLQGSNDGTNFVVLTDPLNNALTFTSAGLKQIAEVTRYIRCAVTAGTTTSVVGTVFTRK
jgi:hypothetical protein